MQLTRVMGAFLGMIWCFERVFIKSVLLLGWDDLALAEITFKAIASLVKLNLLDRDIEIIIRPHTDPDREAGIRVC